MSAPWLTRGDAKPTPGEIPPAIKQRVLIRSGGFCECCGGPCYVAAHAYHHRRPKGMGGSKDASTHTVANVVLVCGRSNKDGCHGDIHGNPDQAREAGWLVRQGADPARIPILLHNGRTVLLTDAGTYEEAAA